MKQNAYFAGKTSALVHDGLSVLSDTACLLGQRLVWASMKIPQIEFYLEQQDVRILRPNLIEQSRVDLGCLLKTYPHGSEHWKIHNLHWRTKHKFAQQLIGFFLLANEVATISSMKDIGVPNFNRVAA